MKPIFHVVMVMAALCSGCAGVSRSNEYGKRARVLWVNDGDTLTVASENGTGDPVRVRVLGVNTPEVWKKKGNRWAYEPDPCGPEASFRTHELTDGQVVILEPDPFGQKTGKYARDLYHVRLPDGRLLSFVLISEGLGRFESYGHKVAHEAALRAAERLADGCVQHLDEGKPLGLLSDDPDFPLGTVFDQEHERGEVVRADVRQARGGAAGEQVGQGLQGVEAAGFVYTGRLFIGHGGVPSFAARRS